MDGGISLQRPARQARGARWERGPYRAVLAEGEEEVLAVGMGAQEHPAVEQRRAALEAPLRGGRAQALPAEELVEGGGEPVDGMSLGHGQARPRGACSQRAAS